MRLDEKATKSSCIAPRVSALCVLTCHHEQSNLHLHLLPRQHGCENEQRMEGQNRDDGWLSEVDRCGESFQTIEDADGSTTGQMRLAQSTRGDALDLALDVGHRERERGLLGQGWKRRS